MARACMTSSVPRVYACSWGARIFQRNRLRCVDCFTCAPKSRRWLVTGTWSGSRASRDRREHSQPSSMAIGRESSSSRVEWCTRDHRRLHTRNSHYCLRRDRSSRTHPIEARQSRSKRTASTVGICRHPGCLRAIGRTCTSSDVDPPPPSHLWEQRCRLGSSFGTGAKPSSPCSDTRASAALAASATSASSLPSLACRKDALEGARHRLRLQLVRLHPLQ